MQDGEARTPHKSKCVPFYAFPELFRGQILAIHTQIFGKIFRKPVWTRTFAKYKCSQQFSGLVRSRECIFREEVGGKMDKNWRPIKITITLTITISVGDVLFQQ